MVRCSCLGGKLSTVTWEQQRYDRYEALIPAVLTVQCPRPIVQRQWNFTNSHSCLSRFTWFVSNTEQKKKRNVFMCFSIMWPPSHHWHQIWHPSSKRWDIWILISGQFSCSGGQSCLCDTSMICLTRAIRVNDLTIYIFHRQTVKKHCLTAAGPTGLTRKEKKGGQQAARRRVQRRQCCVTIRKQDIRGKKPAEEEEHRDYTHGERLQELLCFAFFFW